MIDKINYIESTTYDPYANLAMEEYLMLHCGETECILYLWQNEHTIVIGRNQNPWKECHLTQLEESGGHLVRRLSGGGAVYHDLGNVNFTFLVQKENYDVGRQLDVIIGAMRRLGIQAERSGRNDILADGKKFSGNAFYKQNKFCYHHGTIMLNVDVTKLSRYLNVSADKLKSKGVSSVKSRVTNLVEFVPDLTVARLKKALKESFEEVYGLKAGILTKEDLDQDALQKGRDRFISPGTALRSQSILRKRDVLPLRLGWHRSLFLSGKGHYQGSGILLRLPESGADAGAAGTSDRSHLSEGRYLQSSRIP